MCVYITTSMMHNGQLDTPAILSACIESLIPFIYRVVCISGSVGAH
jgi:hypothetical protein